MSTLDMNRRISLNRIWCKEKLEEQKLQLFISFYLMFTWWEWQRLEYSFKGSEKLLKAHIGDIRFTSIGQILFIDLLKIQLKEIIFSALNLFCANTDRNNSSKLYHQKFGTWTFSYKNWRKTSHKSLPLKTENSINKQ